jgi:hypothetical protein
MKLQVPITRVFPAASLAAASVLLSLLVLPAGGAPVRSSGMAPALKLVAGEVAAAVERPVRAVSRQQPKSAVTPVKAAVAGTYASGTRGAPPHRPTNARRISRIPVVAPTPVKRTAPATSAPVTTAPQPVAGHDHGKRKAWGRLRTVAPSTAVEVKAHGQPGDVPHGPPAVPPDHQTVARGTTEHGVPGGLGGKR